MLGAIGLLGFAIYVLVTRFYPDYPDAWGPFLSVQLLPHAPI